MEQTEATDKSLIKSDPARVSLHKYVSGGTPTVPKKISYTNLIGVADF